MIHAHRYDLDVAGNDDIVNGLAHDFLIIASLVPHAIIAIGDIVISEHRIILAQISVCIEVSGQHFVLGRIFTHDLQHLRQLTLTGIFILMRQMRVVEGNFFAVRCRIDGSRISSGLADAFADQRAAAFIAQR